MRLLFFPKLTYHQEILRKTLAGKTVLITGASYGIGATLALLLANTGAHLLLVARTAAQLIEVQRQVQSRGGRATTFPCDLADPAQIAALTAQLLALPHGIDIVVSNAGKSIHRSIFAQLDRLHDATRSMSVNYHGPVQIILALIPTLVARRGHIINISAVNVLLAPPPRWAVYQASKTAFDQWLRCVGPELATRGVATSSIYLPLVRTRMIAPTRAYDHAPAMSPEAAAAVICQALITRRHVYAPWWMLPAQLAAVVLRGPWERGMRWWLGRTSKA